MASATSNGVNGHAVAGTSNHFKRFSDIPPTVFVTVPDAGENIDVEVTLGEDIQDDPTELCTLLESMDTAKSVWMTVALGYAVQKKVDVAIEILSKALTALSRGRADDRLSLLNAMCWMYLLKCREAPRVKPDAQFSEVKTKDHYIQQATGVLNEASRISPSYPPLFLARGVLLLLRASMQTPPKSTAGVPVTSEKIETLKQAGKAFDDAIRTSSGKNLMAHMGKARVSYSLGKYPEALQTYQLVLERAPDLIDPDPRIGIGCCLWQLNHREEAKMAWSRALELNPDSKIANILMGLYYLQSSAQYNPSDPEFAAIYKRAMTQYVQKAFKLDDKLPLACSTFGGYFLMKKAGEQAERLARRAIDLTDVHAIASDGWYLLARKEHYAGDLSKASEYYSKSDQTRGGDDRGYLPAKFGAAQIKVLMGDFDDAKYRLEKILQQGRNAEALTLLGTIYAEEVFAAQSANSKEDKSQELKKAISYLDSVRAAWKDTKKKNTVASDSAVLLNLARLYEIDGHDEKALQCLLEVEKMELDEIPEEEIPEDITDEEEQKNRLREFLPPQLLNNMGCFYHKAEKFDQARVLFQTALNACMKVDDKDGALDKHALVTTIGYNLARTYESEGLLDEAKKVYEGTLQHYPDYTDAVSRLAYVAILENPKGEGWKSLQKLLQNETSNLEVRALWGWFSQRSKKRTLNLGDDSEFKHYKDTLQKFDKHDRYSLVGMGNIHLTIAREMPRDTEQAKDRRRKMYEKAVEFFDKALQLDPQNAYAAQGIAIALVEDKKDLNTAIQIFTKVKETMKDASVFMNLGHLYTELKQYGRAIENYEIALARTRSQHGNARDRSRDGMTLSCLGRVWLMRGRHEKNLTALKTSLDYSKRALEISPEHPVSKFNVAFVQIQIAQLVLSLQDTQRTLEDVETASADLEEAIESLISIANSPDPPYPKHDLEQRANMGKNTMRRQLERAIQNQREYEAKHTQKLQKARELREAEIKKREEEKRKAEEEAAEKRRKIAEERQRMRELDLELVQKRAEEEARRKELMEEDEIRKAERKAERGSKPKSKRKKKAGHTDDEEEGQSSDDGRARRNGTSATPATSGDERPRQKKKRKLERKSKASSKYKSQEVIENSDSDADGDYGDKANGAGSGDDDEAVSRPRTKATRVIDDDDEDEDGAGQDASMHDVAARAEASDSDE